jgi:hypothetical protein
MLNRITGKSQKPEIMTNGGHVGHKYGTCSRHIINPRLTETRSKISLKPDYTFFAVTLKKDYDNLTYLKLIMTCCFRSKGMRVRRIANCAGG